MPCSYCRISGHNVSNCTDQTLETLYLNMKNDSVDYIVYNDFGGFKLMMLTSYTKKHMKCISIRYTNCKSYLQEHILSALYEHFNELNNLSQTQELQLLQAQQELQGATDTYMLNVASYLECTDQYDNIPKLDIVPKLYDKRTHISNETDICAICYNNYQMGNFVEFNCGHQFCHVCVQEIFIAHDHNKLMNPKCALCRNTINILNIYNDEIYDKLVRYCKA